LHNDDNNDDNNRTKINKSRYLYDHYCQRRGLSRVSTAVLPASMAPASPLIFCAPICPSPRDYSSILKFDERDCVADASSSVDNEQIKYFVLFSLQ
jgi:hypothetical protein